MTDFNERMAQLRAEYRTVAEGDLRSLRQQADSLQGGEADRATLEHMMATLHRIAGGAGVFGLARLSEQARELELDLNDWLAAPLTDAYCAALAELRRGLAGLAVNLA